MEYIKILSPQNCVIFQQRLTISDSRPIKMAEATRSIRDMECIKISGLGEKISAHLSLKPPNIHSSFYDLLAMPNHVGFKNDQACRGNQVNQGHGVHQEIPTGGEDI